MACNCAPKKDKSNVISCETIAIHTITNIILWRFVKACSPTTDQFLLFFLILSSIIVHLPCCLTLPVSPHWWLVRHPMLLIHPELPTTKMVKTKVPVLMHGWLYFWPFFSSFVSIPTWLALFLTFFCSSFVSIPIIRHWFNPRVAVHSCGRFRRKLPHTCPK